MVFAPQEPGSRSSEEFQGIGIRRFPFWEALAPGNRSLFRRTLDQVSREHQEFSPEIVHVGSIDIGSVFERLVAVDYPTPLAVTIQQAEHLTPNRALTSLIRKTLESADWIAFCSDSVKREFGALAGPHKRSSVIPNALPGPGVNPTPLPWDPPIVLCLGRLIRDKGFDVGLRAFSLAADSDPRARLSVVGQGHDRPGLEALAVELGIADRVSFEGAIPHSRVAERIGAATLVAIPSRREAFGLVALEAAQMGRPVVATAAGGLPEVVVHGKTGSIVPIDDVLGMAAAISSLLNDPLGATRMGLAAHKRASRRFDWGGYVSSYEAIYKRLLRHDRARSMGLSAELNPGGA